MSPQSNASPPTDETEEKKEGPVRTLAVGEAPGEDPGYDPATIPVEDIPDDDD